LFIGKTPSFRYIFNKNGNDCSESVFEVRNMLDRYMPYGGVGTTSNTTCRSFSNTDLSGGLGYLLPTVNLQKEFGKDDPRYSTTIGNNGDSILFKYNGANKWLKMDLSKPVIASACRKYECSPDEFWSVCTFYTQSPLNLKIIRYSDVILWAAEAAFNIGDNNKALQYLNMVRTRARNSGNTGKPENLTNISFSNIVHERRIEFALEGWRFFDLVRWNIAKTVMNGFHNTSFSMNIKYVPGENEFFPTTGNEDETKIKHISENSFSIYPNPATSLLNITAIAGKSLIQIYNLQGKLVYQNHYNTSVFSISLSDLNKGIYLIKLKNNNSELNRLIMIK
jgi:hypothetical protein